MLTHWGRVTHICVSKITTIGSNNGLSPGRCQASIWTNAGILYIRPIGTNFNEMLIEILTFSFTKMRLKVSSAKWRPFCLGLNVLICYFGPQSPPRDPLWCCDNNSLLYPMVQRTLWDYQIWKFRSSTMVMNYFAMNITASEKGSIHKACYVIIPFWYTDEGFRSKPVDNFVFHQPRLNWGYIFRTCWDKTPERNNNQKGESVVKLIIKTANVFLAVYEIQIILKINLSIII